MYHKTYKLSILSGFKLCHQKYDVRWKLSWRILYCMLLVCTWITIFVLAYDFSTRKCKYIWSFNEKPSLTKQSIFQLKLNILCFKCNGEHGSNFRLWKNVRRPWKKLLQRRISKCITLHFKKYILVLRVRMRKIIWLLQVKLSIWWDLSW